MALIENRNWVKIKKYHSRVNKQCTVVDLSTRTAFLNIDQSLQFRTFWSQSKALFMIRCMLNAGSNSNTFGALKVTICVKIFELSVHKMSNFLRISLCPVVQLLKKITQNFSVVAGSC